MTKEEKEQYKKDLWEYGYPMPKDAEKEPIRYFNWFQTDTVDKRAYRIFLIILLVFEVLLGLSLFLK